MIQLPDPTGWPDEFGPGVPAHPHEHGFHWMAWRSTGALTVGEWCPDLWMWVTSYLGGFAEPAEMAHLHYIERVQLPRGARAAMLGRSMAARPLSDNVDYVKTATVFPQSSASAV